MLLRSGQQDGADGGLAKEDGVEAVMAEAKDGNMVLLIFAPDEKQNRNRKNQTRRFVYLVSKRHILTHENTHGKYSFRGAPRKVWILGQVLRMNACDAIPGNRNSAFPCWVIANGCDQS